MDDTMTRAAWNATKPNIADSQFGLPNAKSYPGMTRFYGSTFGGVSVDAVNIYPLVPGKWYVSEGFVASNHGPKGVDWSKNRGAHKMILAACHLMSKRWLNNSQLNSPMLSNHTSGKPPDCLTACSLRNL